jgi:hypothetical protein
VWSVTPIVSLTAVLLGGTIYSFKVHKMNIVEYSFDGLWVIAKEVMCVSLGPNTVKCILFDDSKVESD